jgi:pSer/pThr/pTyr-binding forkhead associated (FHA) protein
MSTQPEPSDLDKTDELPVLDVAVYEASLAGEDPLASTDNWMVESLRESEAVRDLESAKRARSRTSPPLISGTVDLSVIDRLEARINALEADLNAAHAAEAEWQRQDEVWSAEREELEQRLAAFGTEKERHEEQQSLSRELIQRLQRQLSELSQQHSAQLAQTESQRASELAQFEHQRQRLEAQLQQRSTEIAQASERQTQLQASVDKSAADISEREREIDELQRTLVTERTKADSLGRHLAAKLADYDIMSSLVTQRNAKVAGLESDRNHLNERLERAQSEIESLNRRLEELSLRAAEADRYANELGQREGQLTKVGSDLERLNRELEDTLAARTRAEKSAAEAQAQVTLLEQQLQHSQRELAEAGATRDALKVERDELLPMREDLAQRMREMETMTAELDDLRESRLSLQNQLATLLPLPQQLEQRTTELTTASEELLSARAQMDELRSQAEAQTHLALGLRQELAIAQQALVDLHAHRDNVQRALDEALRNIERLHAVSRDDTELLNERNAQLTAAKQELDQQAEALQGLEHSLSARDQLIEDLRAEMLTVQDERAIMAEKLTKSRARVKAMTQEIFIRDNRIAVLKSDLAVHTEALAAIRRDVDRIESPSTTAVEPPERMLEPVDHEGDPIVLNRRVMTIGRTNDNDIFIPSKMISRHHARLLVGPNAVIVEDAGSTNGCFVNDQQIKQHVLRDGDVLSIGDLKFRLTVRLPDGSRPRDNVVDFDPNRHLDG